MGFASVYKTLLDAFPQIDSRILRAVAIEHSKDADVAVEVVLVEVIPSLSSSNKAESSMVLFEDSGKTVQQGETIDLVDVISSFSLPLTKSGPSKTDGRLPVATEVVDDGSSGQTNHQRCVEIEGDSVASLGESVVTNAGLFEKEVALDQLDVTSPVANDKYHNLYVDTELVLAPPNSQLVGIRETHLAVTQESDFSSSSKPTTETDALVVELVNSEVESIMTSMLTRSACSTELLEDIIEDARNSKKTLVSAMDLVISMMKEVEFKEKAAEQAKVEAARGCSDILEQVDTLKEALRRAKEANDMHAGEVYAEKAILATELKELELRLFTLSDERDLSLQILDEMRRALEIRLATALEEIKAAEAEKMEKEESARKALAYQESQMEKVVEESKKLKLEAEENSKLQDFLMDRGHAIDMLKGEMSVKCQDVRLLKEKFDKRIPLSQSLSFSQTSSILASSGLSFRSTVTPPEPEPEPETYETPKGNPKVADSCGFLDKISRSGLGLSPESPKQTIYTIDDSFPSGEEKHGDDRKLYLGDDWELFDKDDLFECAHLSS